MNEPDPSSGLLDPSARVYSYLLYLYQYLSICIYLSIDIDIDRYTDIDIY